MAVPRCAGDATSAATVAQGGYVTPTPEMARSTRVTPAAGAGDTAAAYGTTRGRTGRAARERGRPTPTAGAHTATIAAAVDTLPVTAVRKLPVRVMLTAPTGTTAVRVTHKRAGEAPSAPPSQCTRRGRVGSVNNEPFTPEWGERAVTGAGHPTPAPLFQHKPHSNVTSVALPGSPAAHDTSNIAVSPTALSTTDDGVRVRVGPGGPMAPTAEPKRTAEGGGEGPRARADASVSKK